MMNILFLGDVVGKPGRIVIKYFLDNYLDKYNIDFVIANLENASHGKGLTKNNFLDVVSHGIDVVTLGNHYLAKKEITTFIDDYDNLLRPLNLNKAHPGKGSNVFECLGKKIRVTNLIGRVFMNEGADNPFDALESIVATDESDIHIVDFHAEATGEKESLAWAFDGKISALIGTHTHVQTNDARLLKNKTFYLSDVGMNGPYNGILGASRESVIKRTWTGLPSVFGVEDDDTYLLNGVILTFNDLNQITDYQLLNLTFAAKEINQ